MNHARPLAYLENRLAGHGLAVDAAVRAATPADVPVITRIINRANEVEAFFVEGDRTNEADVAALLDHTAFLVAERGGRVEGTVHLAVEGEVGHFSMLAVDPDVQAGGLGRRLLAATEAFFAARGACWSELEIVNLRSELLPFYRRVGYHVTGTEPYVEWRQTKLPVHFITLRKAIVPTGPKED